MIHFLDVISAHGLSRLALDPHTDFLKTHPDLRHCLESEAVEGWLAPTLTTMRSMVPIPHTRDAFRRGSFFRLPMHHRCFYFSPNPPGNGNGSQEPTQGVIAYKGTEPAVADYDAWIEQMRRTFVPERRTAYHPRLSEHFAIDEHKIPGTMTLAEAVREGETAAELQIRHYRVYGESAQMPLPLFAYRLPEEISMRTLEKQRKLLSPRAFEVAGVEAALRHGLGVYVYYYPNPPIRAGHTALSMQNLPYAERRRQLEQRTEPRDAVESWIRNFVRLLFLGYFPTGFDGKRVGSCIDPNNAVIDGGLVDVDSLLPIEDVTDEASAYDVLDYNINTLRSTVSVFLGAQEHCLDSGTIDRWVTRYVMDTIAKALESEARPGLRLGSWIEGYFKAALSVDFDELSRRLQLYYA